jgi:hypothetical protein
VKPLYQQYYVKIGGYPIGFTSGSASGHLDP